MRSLLMANAIVLEEKPGQLAIKTWRESDQNWVASTLRVHHTLDLLRSARSQTRQVFKRPHARKKKICATLDGHETAEAMHSSAKGFALDGENGIALGNVSDQRINFTVQAAEYGIVDPGLLDEFKLPLDVAVQAEDRKSVV